MNRVAKTGFPVLGLVFLVLAISKFMQGESWVVWAILSFVFGGARLFAAKGSEGNRA